MMIKRSKLMLIAAIAAASIASPALAQTYSQRGSSYYQRSEAPRYWNGSSRYGRFNPDSPALTGGGSLGSNELMREDTQ